jgi:TolB-like protein/DNA-binding winged helix-turn-helix (wHTH) protein
MLGQPHGYRFGDFEVQPEAAELRRSGEVIHLEPRVLKVLVYLIEHRDRLVEKTELLDAVWDETFVTENALTKAVGRLRQALDDDAQDPRCVQTVHTLGYRFIARVEETGGEAAALEMTHAPATGRKRLLWAGAVVAIASLAIVLGFGWSGLREWLRGGGTRPEIRSLAVLPLDNLTGDPDQEYLVEAMHEALITELAQLSPLRVIARRSTLRYRDTHKALAEIAEELAVDALVEGSITRSEDRVRVSAQITGRWEDEYRWAGNFDRDAGDLLVLLSELAAAIGDSIQIAITPDQEARLVGRPPASPEAEDAYFRARFFLGRGTPAGFGRALELFETSTELDPGFARAHAGLAAAHFLMGLLGPSPYREAATASEKAATDALELAPDLAEARAPLGLTRLSFDWDWPAAGRELARAIELDPSDAGVRHGYADYLLVTGRPEESLEQAKLGRRYDPVSPISTAHVVGHLLFLRRYDEVVEEARALLEMDPRFGVVRGFLAAALWHRGQHEDSLWVLLDHLEARMPELVDALLQGHRESGPGGAMLALAEQLAIRVDAGPKPLPVSVARYFARGGDLGRSLDFLERALDVREPTLLHVGADPDFDVLRSDPRFADLLRRIGLPRHETPSQTPGGPDEGHS